MFAVPDEKSSVRVQKRNKASVIVKIDNFLGTKDQQKHAVMTPNWLILLCALLLSIFVLLVYKTKPGQTANFSGVTESVYLPNVKADLEKLNQCQNLLITRDEQENQRKYFSFAKEPLMRFKVNDGSFLLVICHAVPSVNTAGEITVATLRHLTISDVYQLEPLFVLVTALNIYADDALCFGQTHRKDHTQIILNKVETVRIFANERECINMHQLLNQFHFPNIKTVEYRRAFFGSANALEVNKFLRNNPPMILSFNAVIMCVDCAPLVLGETLTTPDKNAPKKIAQGVQFKNVDAGTIQKILGQMDYVDSLAFIGSGDVCEDSGLDRFRNISLADVDVIHILELDNECLPLFTMLASVQFERVGSIFMDHVVLTAANIENVIQFLLNANVQNVTLVNVISSRKFLHKFLDVISVENFKYQPAKRFFL